MRVPGRAGRTASRLAAAGVVAVIAGVAGCAANPPITATTPAAVQTTSVKRTNVVSSDEVEGTVLRAAHYTVSRGVTTATEQMANTAATGLLTAGPANARSAMLTSVVAVGSAIKAGTVLYRADTEPVVALTGSQALWRELSTHADDGPDVHVLEQNLQDLGYGDELTVDQHFDADTAAAVKKWETDLDRRVPDGSLAAGDAVSISAATEVVEHRARVGDRIPLGTPILTLATTRPLVRITVDADVAAKWSPGTKVAVRWPDGQTGTAIVEDGARDEVADEVEINLTAPSAAERPNGASVGVRRELARRNQVLAVPVAAIRADPRGRPTVAIPTASGVRQVTVDLGLVADGWVEIRGDLRAGQKILLD